MPGRKETPFAALAGLRGKLSGSLGETAAPPPRKARATRAGAGPVNVEEVEDPERVARHHQEEAALFRRAVGDVTPLPQSNRAEQKRPLPQPYPRQREEDEASALRESLITPFSHEDQIDISTEDNYLRAGLPRRVLADLRRGRWIVQAEIDLHGHTRDDARDALALFLHEALAAGLRCVRLIHGKGLGSPGREPVLKHFSRHWLLQRKEILAFCQARPHDGGEGALLILLQSPRKPSV